jgi:predicted GH43/DUF377 family glycosyl hydrolase
MVGYIIMDGTDPSRIVQRSSATVPLMAPLDSFGTPWEVGSKHNLCNTGNVIFVPSAVKMAAPGGIRLWFGAADAVVGTAILEVHKL